jgi:hypothetical protein
MAKRKGSTFSKPRTLRHTKKRPWLAVAAICEKALVEKDRTPSVIRIIDTLTVESDEPKMPAGMLRFTLFLMFRGGPATGTKSLKISGLAPSGKEIVNHEHQLRLLGDEHSSILDIAMQMSVSDEGLYWFEIRLDGNLETRVPLRVRHRKRSRSAD